MTLPILVEDQSKLPEGFEKLYEENDNGQFVLQVEGVDNHPDVHGLKSAYQKEKEKRQRFSQQVEQFKQKASLIPDDIDEDAIEQLFEQYRVQQTGGGNNSGEAGDAGDAGDTGDAGGKGKMATSSNKGAQPPQQNVDYAKIRDQIEKRFRKDLKERDDTLVEREKLIKDKDDKIRQLIIDNDLSSALTKNKVTNPTYQKAAKRLLADQIKIQEEEDGSLRPIVETDMGEVSLENFVRDWAAGDEGSEFVDGNTGSGARGANKGPKGKKEMTRETFDQLSPGEKMQFTNNGGRVID